MTYESAAPLGFLAPYRNRGMLGLGAAPSFKPECVAWADANYNFAAFDAKCASLSEFLRDAPVWPTGLEIGRATRPYSTFYKSSAPAAWADVEPLGWQRLRVRGRSAGALVRRRGPQRTEDVDVRWARFDYFYTLYLRQAAYFLFNAAVFLRELGQLVNLPPYWLFQTDPASLELSGDGYHQPIAPSNPSAIQAMRGNTTLSSPVGKVVGLFEGEDRAYMKSEHFAMPVNLLTGNVVFDGKTPDSVPNFRTFDNPNKGDTFKANANDLADFWKLFKYDNLPNSERNPRGYPLGFSPDDAMPPAARVSWKKPWGSAEREVGSSYRWQTFMGPQLAVHTAVQLLRRACSRPGTVVVGNAFQTWGGILQRWADSPANDAPAAAKSQMKVAGSALAVAGSTLAGAGAVSGNPVLAGAGLAMNLVAELVKILPVAEASLCTKVPGHTQQGGGARKGLGKLCSPPEPLLVRPPSGCSPSTALALDAERRKGTQPSAWDKFLQWLKQYGPYVGLGTVGLVGMYVAFTAMKKNQRRSRRNRVRRVRNRNRGR